MVGDTDRRLSKSLKYNSARRMFSCPAINAFHPEKVVDSNQDIILKPIFTLGKIQEIQNILLCCRLMDEIVGQ